MSGLVMGSWGPHQILGLANLSYMWHFGIVMRTGFINVRAGFTVMRTGFIDARAGVTVMRISFCGRFVLLCQNL